MWVLVYDPFLRPETVDELGYKPVPLDVLLARADYVSLHCPLTEATYHLIDASRLAQMKRGSRLINCARGALIDEAALCTYLRSGHLAGAALDVYEQERPKGSPVLALDSVVLTPHLGASTSEAQREASRSPKMSQPFSRRAKRETPSTCRAPLPNNFFAHVPMRISPRLSEL
jgi:D-3-phosphoglycerate dehydrogenase